MSDLRIEDSSIAGIESGLTARAEDDIVDADGGALLPGLHDHHIHLLALAAALDSLRCGPPEIQGAAALAALLRAENHSGSGGWVRGIGYHPCVAGDIDRYWLDRCIPDRPVRIQHRGGRLWVLNSRALRELGIPPGAEPPGLERDGGEPTGRLYEGDKWLRERLGSDFPDLGAASALLASCGVTGLTDTSPANGVAEWSHFQHSQESGILRQCARMMGSSDIVTCPESGRLRRGEYKIHLLESRLPDHDGLCREIAAAHRSCRAVAIHCVTEVELVFALAALETAGVLRGDRIEHASVTSPGQLGAIRELGLRVVTQPHFIAERGDQYLSDVEPRDQPWLYRCASFLASGVPLAGGSDAPFGSADPWLAMRAAVERRTRSGRLIGADEALEPEQALSLYLSRPDAPGDSRVTLAVGQAADLCLLDSPWERVRGDLDRRRVRMTWCAGDLAYRAG